jgi:hypothetical protein
MEHQKATSNGNDVRSGAYDAISPAGKQQPPQVREKPTPHEAAQHGADVRSEPLPGTQDPIPEGLLRERKGAAQPAHRPQHGRSKMKIIKPNDEGNEPAPLILIAVAIVPMRAVLSLVPGSIWLGPGTTESRNRC